MAIVSRIKIYLIVFFLLFSGITNASAQPDNYFNKVTVGAELGNWVPNDLNRLNTSVALKIDQESIYSAIYAQLPMSKNLILRLTGGYFYYEESNQQHEAIYRDQSIIIIPVLLDIKYMLLTETRISPYVSYGVGVNFGFENRNHFSFLSDKYDHFTFGVNLGTGLDFLVTHHISLGIEFRYHYLEFPDNFIFTNNYSGTKINIALGYLF